MGGSHLVAQLTLGTFNGHQVAIDLYLNAGWNRDGGDVQYVTFFSSFLF